MQPYQVRQADDSRIDQPHGARGEPSSQARTEQQIDPYARPVPHTTSDVIGHDRYWYTMPSIVVRAFTKLIALLTTYPIDYETRAVFNHAVSLPPTESGETESAAPNWTRTMTESRILWRHNDTGTRVLVQGSRTADTYHVVADLPDQPGRKRLLRGDRVPLPQAMFTALAFVQRGITPTWSGDQPGFVLPPDDNDVVTAMPSSNVTDGGFIDLSDIACLSDIEEYLCIAGIEDVYEQFDGH